MNLRVSWKSGGLWSALLVTMALFPLAWAYPTFPGDERALMEVQGLQAGWLDQVALAVSSLGLVPVSITLILAVSGSLFVLRHQTDALIVILSLVPIVAGNGLKVIVERPRPDYLLVGAAPHGLSFPSGHSVYAILVGGILIFLAEQLVASPLLRRWLQISIALVILAIGASRVYLGVHWPSDVVGGYLFGSMSLLGLIALRKRLDTNIEPACGTRFFCVKLPGSGPDRAASNPSLAVRAVSLGAPQLGYSWGRKR
ncbi:MAG: phosphatase PAP2 family protein [Dehalococcoidia bacterium]|nr:phosphatase PAP2 family protein [Dehalococcoidia bacterium]